MILERAGFCLDLGWYLLLRNGTSHEALFLEQWKIMSRKPALIKVINIEEGMPQVQQARLRMEHELDTARQQGYAAVKLIHGYGSSGVGGMLRTELQKELRNAVRSGMLRASIAGEDWRVSDETTWALLKKFPEWKQDSDLSKGNRGITVVVL
jgi:hypothetical protein